MGKLIVLYDKLKSFLEEERKIIESEELEKLKDILEKKRDLISQINEIDLQDYLKKTVQNSDEAAEKERKKLYEKMKKINELETENLELLNENKAALKDKIVSLYSREKSLKGYNKKDKFEAKFFDKKS